MTKPPSSQKKTRKRKKKSTSPNTSANAGDTPSSKRTAEMDAANAVRQSLETAYSPQVNHQQVFTPHQGQFQTFASPYMPSQIPLPQSPDTSAILAKLDLIDKKLSKLDAIEHDVLSIKTNMSKLEHKVQEIDTLRTRLDDIAESNQFISDCFDTWTTDKAMIKSDMKALKDQIGDCVPNLSNVMAENLSLKESFYNND